MHIFVCLSSFVCKRIIRQFYLYQSNMDLTFHELICCAVATPVGPCNKTRPLPLTSSEGWISSLVTAETRCGTKDSPWVIEALPGQRIQLTVNDLSGACSNSRYVIREWTNCLFLPGIRYCIVWLNASYSYVICCTLQARALPAR